MSHHLEGLRFYRIQEGLTASQAGALIGVTGCSFTRYETGARRIYFDQAAHLARYFGVTIDQLMHEPAPEEAALLLGELTNLDTGDPHEHDRTLSRTASASIEVE